MGFVKSDGPTEISNESDWHKWVVTHAQNSALVNNQITTLGTRYVICWQSKRYKVNFLEHFLLVVKDEHFSAYRY